MELKGVEAFVTVAELESMNAAARKLGYAQSTVTMQIKNLERDMKATLLERSLGWRRTRFAPSITSGRRHRERERLGSRLGAVD